ncbi:histidine utilization repressor [Rhizobium sp. KVB221]|uniref:Histidine utilization repressor n=1 Tax=Rhizobium setariae TaxID=2801340 RepID=A0A937CKT3_9HYPH|nr:histidine utilization repressor [Rhizobium setariae]MBL0372470.1 histidine utilization repressor [Rhizobium setariae]
MTVSQTIAGANTELSLHQRIVNEIEGRILSGEWPPGHRLPFELELAEQYGCSRMTVNKAMAQLARTGLIERRKKSGSFVIQPHAQSAVLEISEIKQEVEGLGKTYRYKRASREMRKATSDDRALLDLSASGKVVEVTALHYAGERVFCFEERLINLAAVPEAAEETFADTAPGSWLLQQVPWSAAEHKIKAVAADDDIASALSIPPGSACLVVERRTSMQGTFITHVRLTYLGSSHELVARFTPSQTGQI